MTNEGNEATRHRLAGPATAVIVTAAVVDFAAVLGAVGPPTRTAVVVVATLGILLVGFRLAGAERVTPKAVIASVVVVVAVALVLGGILASLPGREIEAGSVALAVGLVAAVAAPAAVVLLLRRLVRCLPVRSGDVLAGLLVVVAASVGAGGIFGAWASPRQEAAPAGAAPPSADPFAVGKAVYSGRCATCHGLRGEGGIGPKLRGGEVKLTFPDEADHENWVKQGSAPVAGHAYGDPNRPGGQHRATGGMPGFATMLTEEEIKAVVAYERERL